MIGRDSLAAQAGRALADDRAPLRATATRRQDVGAFVAATHYVSRDAEHAWACLQASGNLFAFLPPHEIGLGQTVGGVLRRLAASKQERKYVGVGLGVQRGEPHYISDCAAADICKGSNRRRSSRR